MTDASSLADDLSKMTLAAGVPKNEVMSRLKDIRDAHQAHEDEYQLEWNELKLKYLQKFEEQYELRHSALSSAWATGEPGTPAVPGFWLVAMQHHNIISGMIELQDEPILKFLDDIKFEWLDPKLQTGFTVNFHFVPNPFFTNTKLSKTFEMEKDEEGDCVLTRTVGTLVEWKEGQDITKKKVTRKQKHKKTKQTRTIEDEIETDSFFNLFKSNEIPPSDKLDEMRHEDVEALELLVEAELEIGCSLRDKIIPHATGWYLGEERDSDEETDSEVTADEDSSDEDS